jgi:intein/homing endonuclease
MAFTEKQEKTIVDLYINGQSTVKIGKLYNISPSSINWVLKKNSIKLRSNKENSKKYSCDERFFENIDNEKKAYWLGFMYADGYVSSRKDGKLVGISVTKKDKNHLEKFLNDIKGNHHINTYKQSNGYTSNQYCRVTICGDNMFNDLVSHGVVENKTLILKPPKINENLIRHFIRGYVDGDGCITSSLGKQKNGDQRKSPDFKLKICGTIEMLDFIKSFIEDNTNVIIRRYYKRRKTDKIENIDLGGNKQVRQVLDLLYRDATIFLQRKYEKYIELCNCTVLSIGNDGMQ